jgi:hypothetical protein
VAGVGELFLGLAMFNKWMEWVLACNDWRWCIWDLIVLGYWDSGKLLGI